jgi:arylsulfatase A-like enzyme
MDNTRRQFLKSAGLGAATLALPAVRAQKKRPNILILFTDDQRFSTLNALNNPEVRTPNMDRLMRNGTTFTHNFIMGGTVPAVCMPSRGMLMTGQTLFHVHDSLVAPQDYPDAPKRPFTTFPETLRKAGYTTFGTGKWHNGERLFSRSFSAGENIFFGGMSNHLQVPVADFDPTGEYPKEKRHIGEKFSSNLFSDSAIKFLRNYKDDKPFLMYVAYTAPHDPRMAPKEYADMYKPENIKLPENFLPRHPFDNGEMEVRDEALAPWPRTPQVVREHIAAYYGMITHADAQMGRVLDTLEQTGHANDTIVIFAADNGLAVGQHGLLGKQNLYDHSVRVPLVIGGPGLPRGARCDSFCYLLDLFPTICDLTGLPVPATVEGKSLAPLLKNPKAKVRDTVFFAYRHVQRGVRTDRWKLIRYNVNGLQTTQLFDLQSDPLEIKNLAAEPSQASRLGEMTALLKRWMRETDDRLDLDKPDWGYQLKQARSRPIEDQSVAE